jgi:PqqD family protein of HPr-rel-A system
MAVWHLPNGTALSWRCWDGDFVVFSSASGRTHMFDALSAWTLQKIESAPVAQDALVTQLAGETGLGEDDLTKRMDEILAEFETQGLAERG